MVRAANLIVALFLALAPGLSAARLLHSLELCVYSPAPVVAGQHTGCGHEHGDEPERHDPRDCPHLEDMALAPGAMNVTAPVPFDLPPPPVAAPLNMQVSAPGLVCAGVAPDRPPTGPPLVGCVIFRI